jgi:hypothetical protein
VGEYDELPNHLKKKLDKQTKRVSPGRLKKRGYHHGDLKAATVAAAVTLIARYGARGFSLGSMHGLGMFSIDGAAWSTLPMPWIEAPPFTWFRPRWGMQHHEHRLIFACPTEEEFKQVPALVTGPRSPRRSTLKI